VCKDCGLHRQKYHNFFNVKLVDSTETSVLTQTLNFKKLGTKVKIQLELHLKPTKARDCPQLHARL